MDNHHKVLSMQFYDFLCGVIGTKEVVDKRRRIFAMMEDRDVNKTVLKGLSSGSKTEGLDLAGSDYDLMHIDNRIQVFEQSSQVKNIDKKIPFIMDTENTKAGFTRLLVHHPQIIFPHSDCMDIRTGFFYFSSNLLLQKYYDGIKRHLPRELIHGPCTSDGNIDSAYSLHCSEWISQALPWVKRSKYSWASDIVIRNILSFGVLFVPIGTKHSPFTDLEWRISFSYAEAQLIFCFNHVQLFCYALLKILLKDIVKKKFGDLLCSYFMKTIMFWLCEETELSYWRAENMLSCFMTCFRRLIYCVENEACLHYFMPENNLFEHRFGKQHDKLLSTLHGLYVTGWKCLLQTETLQSFRFNYEIQLSSNISLTSFIPFLRFLDLKEILDKRDYFVLFKRFMYQTLRSRKGMDLYIYLISSMCQSFPQKSYDEHLVQRSNRLLYKHFRRRLSNLLIGLNRDAVSGWLLLASFFFTNKQYTVSKTIIDYCFTKFTEERCELQESCAIDVFTLQRFNEQEKTIGLRCLKIYCINLVILLGNCSLIPDELRLLVENNTLINIPSLLYAHFLNFLFYHTIGDEGEKRKSYRQLVLTGKHEYVETNYHDHSTQDHCLHIAENLMHCNNYFN